MLKFGAMLPEDEKAKLRFELTNANLQSVGRAQALYLSTLLVYICVVWVMFLTGSGETDKLHFGWLELKMDAVWAITPFVMMVLTLAVVGTLNAVVSAYSDLQDAGRDLLGSDFGSLFEVDTHKNVIDYLERLQIFPRGKTRKPSDHHGREPLWLRSHHLIFPVLFIISLFTSWWAVHRPKPAVFWALSWICFAVQVLFSVRPMVAMGSQVCRGEGNRRLLQLRGSGAAASMQRPCYKAFKKPLGIWP